MAAAAGDDDTLDGGATAQARFILAAVNAMLELEEPGLAGRWTGRLANFTSRRWQAAEVALMTSEREPGGHRYRVARAFELDGA